MDQESVDVVVVGGGIAGSALAAVLARDGLGVLVLERQTAYRDKVRGEFLACWGVAEMQRLNLEKPLLNAGGCYVTRAVFYDEIFDPSEAEARARPLDQLLPGVPGSFDVGHPEACEALNRAAADAGATVIRGVGDIAVSAGASPSISYEHDDLVYDVSCRLVVGADGRMSTVRRQLGIALEQTTPRTMCGGMLVDELHAWPSDQVALGTEGDLHYLFFPRPGGRARLYLLHDIGQKGLSIALRDVRIVADILRSTEDWCPGSFADYGEERRERMRRLLIAARVAAEIRATFSPRGAARRRTYSTLMATDPVLAGPLLAPQLGPEQLPAESFEKSNIDRVLALS